MIRNIRGHRIRWSVLLAQGAFAGLASAVVMLAVAMVTIPLLADNMDSWSFAKAVSTVFLGNGAAEPITGFEFAPVVVGLILHFVLAGVAGAVYGAIVGIFDLEGWTPVAVLGLIFGAMTFIWSAVLIGSGFTSSVIADLPLGALLWGNVSFGICAGLLLATWAERADLDRQMDDESERVLAFEGDEAKTGLPR